MTKHKCNECQYFRLKHTKEKGIHYVCKYFESDVEFNGDICNKFTTEKDIFNIW